MSGIAPAAASVGQVLAIAVTGVFALLKAAGARAVRAASPDVPEGFDRTDWNDGEAEV